MHAMTQQYARDTTTHAAELRSANDEVRAAESDADRLAADVNGYQVELMDDLRGPSQGLSEGVGLAVSDVKRELVHMERLLTECERDHAEDISILEEWRGMALDAKTAQEADAAELERLRGELEDCAARLQACERSEKQLKGALEDCQSCVKGLRSGSTVSSPLLGAQDWDRSRSSTWSTVVPAQPQAQAVSTPSLSPTQSSSDYLAARLELMGQGKRSEGDEQHRGRIGSAKAEAALRLLKMEAEAMHELHEGSAALQSFVQGQLSSRQHHSPQLSAVPATAHAPEASASSSLAPETRAALRLAAASPSLSPQSAPRQSGTRSPAEHSPMMASLMTAVARSPERGGGLATLADPPPIALSGVGHPDSPRRHTLGEYELGPPRSNSLQPPVRIDISASQPPKTQQGAPRRIDLTRR